MIEIYTAKLQEMNETLYHSYLTLLPLPLQQEVTKYHQRQDRYRTLLGKVLLHRYLQKHTHFSLKNLKKTEYGRPYIEGWEIDFNISHSGEYVLCAFNNHGVVGIDIEENHKNIELDDFKMLFSIEEWQQIQNASNKTQQFYTLWTRKEALLKATGKGLLADIRQIKMIDKQLWFNNSNYFYQTFRFERYTISVVYNN